jgi:hypothetical protein
MPYKTEGEINAANEGTLYPVLVTVHLETDLPICRHT